jgi:hypothetical protein
MTPQHINDENIDSFIKKHPGIVVHDKPELAIDELFDIKYPEKKDNRHDEDVAKFRDQTAGDDLRKWGEWVYYPWLNQLVHFPPKAELRSLRTSRNRNLIATGEQSKLYEATIFVVGMSVGSNVVEALVAQGIGGKLILTDMDIVEPSNLNRIRSPYHHVGLHKVDAISRKVWEIDPYIEIVGYLDGLNDTNLTEILDQHAPNILIDEMDELRMKIVLREAAKQRQLPVIMAADDGDDALLDIERYDLDPDQQLFAGRIPERVLELIKRGSLSRPQIGMMIGKYFVGPDNIPLRMYESLAEVGKTLPSWPQLGGAAALSGVSLAYVARKIILGEKLQEGRVLVSLDDKLNLDTTDPEHKVKLERFKNMMDGSANE